MITSEPHIRLRLYVAGTDPLTVSAHTRLGQLLRRIGVGYEVEVVDVEGDPAAAERDRVTVTPTLERVWPPPIMRVTGDLSDLEFALDDVGLRIWELPEADPAV